MVAAFYLLHVKQLLHELSGFTPLVQIIRDEYGESIDLFNRV